MEGRLLARRRALRWRPKVGPGKRKREAGWRRWTKRQLMWGAWRWELEVVEGNESEVERQCRSCCRWWSGWWWRLRRMRTEQEDPLAVGLGMS